LWISARLGCSLFCLPKFVGTSLKLALAVVDISARDGRGKVFQDLFWFYLPSFVGQNAILPNDCGYPRDWVVFCFVCPNLWVRA
jgi:hypothetical protein